MPRFMETPMATPIEAAGAKDGFAITESDTTIFRADALYIGTGGDVVVTTSRGTALTFADVPGGFILPIACTQVKAASTAADIVGLVY